MIGDPLQLGLTVCLYVRPSVCMSQSQGILVNRCIDSPILYSYLIPVYMCLWTQSFSITQSCLLLPAIFTVYKNFHFAVLLLSLASIKFEPVFIYFS